MLPIYEAIEVNKVINEKVGHTKPWVVTANTPKGLTSFVTKLYSTSQVDQFHCVSKEIVCNLLATEFELPVPQCVLIEIPEDIVLKLSSEAQQQFDNSDPRLKFATVLIENVNSALPSLPKQHFQKRIPLDTLYAFDNFIRNSDRGHPKVNLLLSPKEAFLIDHELALGENDIVNINLNSHQLEDRFTKYHLFYHFLKKTKRKYRQNFFNDFELYLNGLSLNKLDSVFKQLKNERFMDYSEPIINWLNQVKLNSTIFVDKLKGSVQ